MNNLYPIQTISKHFSESSSTTDFKDVEDVVDFGYTLDKKLIRRLKGTRQVNYFKETYKNRIQNENEAEAVLKFLKVDLLRLPFNYFYSQIDPQSVLTLLS